MLALPTDAGPGTGRAAWLNRFEPRDQAQPAIATAMAVVRPASALVFDLRSCQGGDPQTVELVAGYLFDTRVLLGTRHSRLHKEVREFRSENVSRATRFGADKPVYVLTSRRTGSGAEMFAGALQDLKRAVLAGETTGGAGHAAMDMAVTDLFWVRMPYATVLRPVSKRGWERIGVSPDMEVPADGALDAALQNARRSPVGKWCATVFSLAPIAVTMAQPTGNEFQSRLRSGNVAALATAIDKDPGLATRPHADDGTDRTAPAQPAH